LRLAETADRPERPRAQVTARGGNRALADHLALALGESRVQVLALGESRVQVRVGPWTSP
jgi:hypothetical protein